jgi:hypothetical protein
MLPQKFSAATTWSRPPVAVDEDVPDEQAPATTAMARTGARIRERTPGT